MSWKCNGCYVEVGSFSYIEYHAGLEKHIKEECLMMY